MSQAARGPWGFIQAFFLGGALVAVWMAPQWQWDGVLTVGGTQRLSPELVRQIAQAGDKRPLYRVDPGQIRARLKAMEAVEDVRVRRWLFPARVEITVKERSPRVRLLDSQPPAYLDANGVRFTLPEHVAPARPPITAELGTRSLSVPEARALALLLEQGPERGSLDLRDPSAWKVTLGAVMVMLGPPIDIEQKLRVARHTVELAQREGKALEYVDVRVPEVPTVVRQRPPTP